MTPSYKVPVPVPRYFSWVPVPVPSYFWKKSCTCTCTCTWPTPKYLYLYLGTIACTSPHPWYSGVFYTILVMVPGIWLCVSDRLVCCRLHLFFYDALREWLRFSSEAGTGHPATVSSTTVCSCGVTCDQAPPSGQDGVQWIYLLCLLRARWYRIDILAVNIMWLYYVDISLSYFPIEFALWANYLSAIWLFVFCSQIVKWIL